MTLRMTVIGLIKDGDESAYKQEVEQLAVWCSRNNLELKTLKTVEMLVDFSRNPPAHPPLIIMDSTVAAVVIQTPGNHHLSGPEVGQSHLLYCVKGPSEAVFSPPAEEVQPAIGAAEKVLLCHNRVCPVFIYNCLVWFSNHQKTTMDSQDCWADYRCPSAKPPRTLHLQSEEKG